jgi:hypothetical protein
MLNFFPTAVLATSRTTMGIGSGQALPLETDLGYGGFKLPVK